MSRARTAFLVAVFLVVAIAAGGVRYARATQRYENGVALAAKAPAPRVPVASVTRDLSYLLLPVPDGAVLARPDRAFTTADAPADVVWRGLAHRGFVRGVTRSWRAADGSVVDIVLLQFDRTEDAAEFTQNTHDDLAGWPGCGGWVGVAGTSHGQVYGCEAALAGDSAGCRATFYRYELAGYLVVTQPGRPTTPPVVNLVIEQARRLG